jgi:hypothetical protein
MELRNHLGLLALYKTDEQLTSPKAKNLVEAELCAYTVAVVGVLVEGVRTQRRE